MGMRTLLRVAAHTGPGLLWPTWWMPFSGCSSSAMCTRISLVRSVAMHATPTLASDLSIYRQQYALVPRRVLRLQPGNNTVQQSSAAVQQPTVRRRPTHPLARLLQYCGGGALPSARAARSAKTVCLRRVPCCECVPRGRRARMRASRVAHARHDARVPRAAYLHPQSAPAGAMSSTISSGGDSACRSTHARPGGPLRHSPQSATRSVQVCRDSIRFDSIRFDSTRLDKIGGGRRRTGADRRASWRHLALPPSRPERNSIRCIRRNPTQRVATGCWLSVAD
jgi:hypothetical protein